MAVTSTILPLCQQNTQLISTEVELGTTTTWSYRALPNTPSNNSRIDILVKWSRNILQKDEILGYKTNLTDLKEFNAHEICA